VQVESGLVDPEQISTAESGCDCEEMALKPYFPEGWTRQDVELAIDVVGTIVLLVGIYLRTRD
jgi:hypothetical protein